jgi:TIGR02677 family protein
MRPLEAIKETTYLTVVNASQYRRIMRIFFREYERMHFQLDKDEIMHFLQEYPEFEEYSIDQLKLDLNALVEWKNLTPIQDPKRVYTIADYKNKQFRYSMSEYAVEVERLTVRLENLFIESSSLSPSYFVRIEGALARVHEIQTESLKNINEWWYNLQEDFKRLNQNYQDYLREFYSGKADKLLKSVEFIVHKDRVITYLQEFIRELQNHASKIEHQLRGILENDVEAVLEKVVKSELEVPHPSSEMRQTLELNVRENIYGKWEALTRWFVSAQNRPSESARVLDVTDEVIRKIIQNAALIVQLQNWGISRKSDYLQFISMFLKCQDMNEAHKLSAHIYGIQHIRHYKVNAGRSTDSINSSVYEEVPVEYELKPRTRTYRARIDKSGFDTKTMEKLAQRTAYLKQVEIERKMVDKYIQGNQLDISQIEDEVAVHTRETLLRWIAMANTTNSKSGRTEFGQAFKLIRKEESCILKCEDGDLRMPVYIFEFAKE